MKFLFWLLALIASVMVAMIPEAVMYFAYHLIAPTTELTRIIVLGIFWICGGAVCIGFGALGVFILVGATTAVLD